MDTISTIERVARAIYETQKGDGFDKLSAITHWHWCNSARAALLALSVPEAISEGMERAAELALDPYVGGGEQVSFNMKAALVAALAAAVQE